MAAISRRWDLVGRSHGSGQDLVGHSHDNVRWGSRLEGRVVRRQQSAGGMETRPRAALLGEPASAGGGAEERRTAPLSLACLKTVKWLRRFTRALLRDRAARFVA